MFFLLRSSFFNFGLGLFLLLICSIKLVFPTFFDSMSFLTYGRLLPVAYDFLIYGWAIPLGFALVLWFTSRFSQAVFTHTRVLVVAAYLWNAAVFLGSLAVLAGYGTSVPFLEYPNWASFLLFVSFLLMGIWAILLMQKRECQSLSVSQWYFLTALCSFPWMYGTANMLLTWGRIEGSAQAPIQCWYGASLVELWLTPVALGIIYYIIPKISGVKIYNYYLALFGFLSLLFLSGWSGLSSLLGAPIPAWMMSAGVVANTLASVSMLAVVVNFYHMFKESQKVILLQSPALRFVAAGIIFYVIATFLSLLNMCPGFNSLLNFTDNVSASLIVSLLGFFGMTLFAGVYYIIPRLTGISWFSSVMIRWHFWLSIIGTSVMISSMVLGGVIEGAALNDSEITFTNILSYAQPWRFLISISWLILIIGFACFIRLLVMMRWQIIKEKLPMPQ
jgi:cytochrome c oxidase cbb3-type subunit 1